MSGLGVRFHLTQKPNIIDVMNGSRYNTRYVITIFPMRKNAWHQYFHCVRPWGYTSLFILPIPYPFLYLPKKTQGVDKGGRESYMIFYGMEGTTSSYVNWTHKEAILCLLIGEV